MGQEVDFNEIEKLIKARSKEKYVDVDDDLVEFF